MVAQIAVIVLSILVLLICHYTVEEMVAEKDENLSADSFGVTFQFSTAFLLSLGIVAGLWFINFPLLWAILVPLGGGFLFCCLDYYVLCAFAGLKDMVEKVTIG